MASPPSPRAVVIPFGVPPAGRGLGLGLAALVHGFAQVEGASVALAQLLARPSESTRPPELDAAAVAAAHDAARGGRDALVRSARVLSAASGSSAMSASSSASAASAASSAASRGEAGASGPGSSAGSGSGANASGPVETFLPPQAWRDLAAQGDAPPDVQIVVTGALEPPREGTGMLELLAFDARNGVTRARAFAHLDGAHAGRAVLAALDEVCRTVGGDVGNLRDIADLDWEALESVLFGERCILHDPRRGGPHDRLAAMVHLGRAVGDAPSARFPAGRLAAIAIDTAVNARDVKLASAALRALERASEDAPTQTDLREACAALHVRLGNADAAEAGALAAISSDPSRARLYALLSEARRARGDIGGALAAVQRGLEVSAVDPVLLTERGVILASEGDLTGARAAWERAVDTEPIFPAAFGNLASLVVKTADAEAAQALVDRALASRAPHPEILRRAIHLALTAETDGLPRASRVAALSRALLVRAPGDPWAALTLARALSQMGETSEALTSLAHVEATAPASAFAAEAQRARFALEKREDSIELDSVVRAALHGRVDDLGVISARAHRLALEHPIWVPLYALGVAERRRGLFAAARRAFEGAVERAPGCVAAHLELVGTCASLSDLDASLLHAIRARSLEESPRTTGSLAEALFAKGRLAEAQEAIGRALGLDPEDAENRRLAARIREVVAQGVGAPRVRSSVPPAREGFGLFSWIAGAFKKRDGETDGDA